MNDIIIIGAGAAGLNAARILSKAGKSVLVLETRDRIGGRIHTAMKTPFSKPVETGAEFMHGKLPKTTALIEEARVGYRKGEGRMWSVEAGHLEEGGGFDNYWNDLIKALKKLDHDIPIAVFLTNYFPGDTYKDMRQSVTKFVQGFDAADPNKASAFALREEWTSDEDLTGYHIIGGYSQLMNHLQKEAMNHGAVFHLAHEVSEIHWKKNEIKAITTKGKEFRAGSVIITIPPAVLKTSALKFTPAIPEYAQAIQQIETGGVIKFLVEFHEAYWEKENAPLRYMPELHFLFSDATVPTWWSQQPDTTPLLTGWLSGPITATVTKSEEELKDEAFESLAYLLNCDKDELKSKIKAMQVINWMKDPFSLGAYAYRTVDTPDAMKTLTKPVVGTIYFAGEAYYDGSEMGTVEAALACGELRANEILKA